MAIETEILNLAAELGKLGKWIQALGLVIILWFLFQLITLLLNVKRRKSLKNIESRLSDIEKKINRILKKSRH